MAKDSISIRELKDGASSVIERVEQGEAVTVTKRGRPVARIVSVTTPPHLAALIAAGSVKAGGVRHIPTPSALRGAGKEASDYVSEGRR